MNCLNKKTHFIWYLKKEKRYDIEALFVDRVLNNEHLLENHGENVQQRLFPDSFLTLVNNPKIPLHVRNSFKNKIF